jgi:ferritin-like metal-binding protein YciE
MPRSAVRGVKPSTDLLMNEHKQLIAWLNDAYSMERSLTNVLENHAKDAQGFPEIHQRQEQHLIETQGHAQQLERCLSILGEKPFTVKGVMGSAMGTVEGAATGMFRRDYEKRPRAIRLGASGDRLLSFADNRGE